MKNVINYLFARGSIEEAVNELDSFLRVSFDFSSPMNVFNSSYITSEIKEHLFPIFNRVLEDIQKTNVKNTTLTSDTLSRFARLIRNLKLDIATITMNAVVMHTRRTSLNKKLYYYIDLLDSNTAELPFYRLFSDYKRTLETEPTSKAC